MGLRVLEALLERIDCVCEVLPVPRALLVQLLHRLRVRLLEALQKRSVRLLRGRSPRLAHVKCFMSASPRAEEG